MGWSGSAAAMPDAAMSDAPAMRWWGWGDRGHAPSLDAQAVRFLQERIGTASVPRPPVALEQVRLQASALSVGAQTQLREIVGVDGLRMDHGTRVAHAAGRSYTDLLALRAGAPEGAPDAVAYPTTSRQLRTLLAVCARSSIAVVPFGGGTSVVGGVAPLRGHHATVLALDLRGLNEIVALDRESLLVSVGAGLRAVALERKLAREGLTLGHFPQSFEYVSLGGCAATRSAGQASTGYGRFDELVQGIEMVAPAGDLRLPAFPATAAGPDLRQLVVGSEGTLGVIAGLTLRVHRAPVASVYEGVFFRDFAAGVAALRALAQEDVAPTVARLSDEQETTLSLALAGGGGLKGGIGRAYLGARGYRGGCLTILGFEGSEEHVSHRRKRALELVRRHGALPVGRSPGRAWLAGRYSAPYLRDELLTFGVMVETLETATRWSNLQRLHGRVGSAIANALQAQGTPGMVMCHVSHLYETGASLYFTFLARQREGAEVEQWRAVKQAASEAIVEGGGTLTHHHAIGSDHAPWLEREIGHQGVAALRALKAELDPTGIMNPGKLLSG
jgi:alkyldihydroxyacetonephosphate synthase